MFYPRSLPAILLAIAFVGSVSASPEYPEVIPGPGMPSLQSLGITSKELYEGTAPGLVQENHKLELRSANFDRVCNDNGCGRVPRGDAQACINYLNSLGTQFCTVPGPKFNHVSMCTAGKAHITGVNYKDSGASVSSYCRDVAAGGQNVINTCTDRGGNVAGADAAQGNGDLVVAIEGC